MAKGKKKEPLTPEERLQAALVPESEQPYKLPENWCWTRLGDITEIVGGGTPSSSVTEYYCNGLIPWISPADLSGYTDIYISRGAKNITELGLEKSSAKMLPTNTVCLSSRAPIGYVVIAKNPLCTNQGFKSFLPASCYLPQYLYWYLKGNKELLESYASGTTFLELSASKAGLVEFPLAPLPEQQRIVERIESLFSKLDEAKQKAQDALDSFETRKAAILHKAFTGELTAQWRKEHGETMESWKCCSFENCVLKMQNGLSKRSSNSGTPFIVVRLANLSDDGFITDDLREILLDEKEQKNYSLKDNDILMIRVNGSKDNVGKQFLFSNKQNWAFCDHIIRITYKEEISPAYMVYFSKTNIYRRYIEDNMVSSAGQNTISRKGMASLLIPVPLITEQTEIVRILDDLLAKEQQAKEAAEGVLEQIDLIKKAILARAFRGELGTNDPKEESAVELLKQVLSC